jgi:hypothetical protein|tara:strand:+ start:505 stop:705 length:201 start_codon:yes stop_codon:yes gene_type:complete
MSDLKEVNSYLNATQNNQEEIPTKKVNLTDLVARMKDEKRKEKNGNIILSAAAVSAVTIFGIILTL